NTPTGSVVVTKNTTGRHSVPTRRSSDLPETVSATGSISTSGGTGTFTFSNLAPSPTASYTVSEAANASFSAMGPTSCAVTVSAGARRGTSLSNSALRSTVAVIYTVDGTG